VTGNVLAVTTATISVLKNASSELEEYLATSDWHKRIKIQNETGQNELIASRIFRAFDLIKIGKAPRDDVSEVDAAWEELLRNPALTVLVLKPVLFESVDRKDRESMSSMPYPPVSDQYRDIVFSVFRRIATFEVTTNAMFAMQELSKSPNAEIAREAKHNLQLALEENWRAKKAIFQATHSGEILNWFADNVFHKGLNRRDIEMYLGKGTEAPDFSIRYTGRVGPQAVVLKLRFWDDYLVEWKVLINQ